MCICVHFWLVGVRVRGTQDVSGVDEEEVRPPFPLPFAAGQSVALKASVPLKGRSLFIKYAWKT